MNGVMNLHHPLEGRTGEAMLEGFTGSTSHKKKTSVTASLFEMRIKIERF